MAKKRKTASDGDGSTTIIGILSALITFLVTMIAGGHGMAIVHFLHSELFIASVIAISWGGAICWSVTTFLYCSKLHYLRRPGPGTKQKVAEARVALRKLTKSRFGVAVVWVLMNLKLTQDPSCSLALWVVEVPLAVGVAHMTSLNNKLVGAAKRSTGLEWMHGTGFARWYRDLFDDMTDDEAKNRAIHFFCRKAGPRLMSHYALLVMLSLVTLSVAVPVSRGAAALDLRSAPPVMQNLLDDRLDSVLSQESQRPTPAGNTWEDICVRRPGASAPAPEADELDSLYLGEGSGVGAIEGGCTVPAMPVPRHSGLWMTLGTCDGRLRSMGISTSTGGSALLFQEVATYAAMEALAGDLTGASGRWSVAGGDMQMIYTNHGNTLMVRDHATTGELRSAPGRSCEDWNSGNVSYVTLPPGLVRLWLKLMDRGFAWPETSPSVTGTNRDFRFRDAKSNRIVASATCGNDGACILKPRGGPELKSRGGAMGFDDVVDSIRASGVKVSPALASRDRDGAVP